jgi:hypothetical protein
VHLVVDNVADLSKINRVDDFIIPVLFIAVKIFCLTSVACVLSARVFEPE